MATIEELAAALRTIAMPGIKPKALRAAIRERYPDAANKEIVRAAFYAIAETSLSDHHGVAELHDFALLERASGDVNEAIPVVSKRKKRKHRSSSDRPAQTKN